MSEKRNVPMLRFPEFDEEWSTSMLGEVVDITSASRVHKDEWTEHGVPFYRSSDVVAAFNRTTNTKAYIPLELYKSLTNKTGCVKKDDLLVTGGGSIGIPFLIKTNAPFYFKDADLLWLKNTNKIRGYFLHSFFTTQSFKRYLRSSSHIGTIAHYTVIQAKNTPFQFPSLPEQQKIASFLTSVDWRIELLQQKKEKLERYKKGVMQHLFTRKIRFKADDGSEFPDWEEKKLGDVGKFLKGKGISKNDISEDGNLECIRYGQLYTEYGEVIDQVKSKTDVDPKNLILSQANDVIIPSSGETQIDIARASCVIRAGIALGGDLNIIRSPINGVFLSYFLNHRCKNEIAKMAQGISVVHLYNSQLELLQIEVPSAEEQIKIVRFMASLETTTRTIEKQIKQSQIWKKGLLQQMFV